MRFCSRCGTPVIDNASFCHRCGTALKTADTAQSIPTIAIPVGTEIPPQYIAITADKPNDE